MNNTTSLHGITPVLQCLLYENRKCHQLLIKENSSSPRIKEIKRLAAKKEISIQKVSAHKLAAQAKTKHHQGVVLLCGELKTLELDEFLTRIHQYPQNLLIALDQVEDPQNVGAIIRSASFLGAQALITLKKHTAPLSATVSKASAGALEYFPIIQVGNLSESLQKLRKNGFTIIGSTLIEDSFDFKELPQTDNTVLVLGNEGQGLRQLTQKRCDFLVHIPGQQTTESLNVNAAAAILIHHLTQGAI